MSSKIKIKISSLLLTIMLLFPLVQVLSEPTVLTGVFPFYFALNELRNSGGQLVTQASSANYTMVSLNSPNISNGVACIQFNNPPPYPGGTYPIHWDVFKVALNGGNPSNYPNLFIGDLRGTGTGGELFYDTGFGSNDGSPEIGPYTQLYVINNNTIMGVINASNGLTEVSYYELVGRLPAVYINFTVNNAPQPTEFWYGLDFISSIYVNYNPGETKWVTALGVGNYSFPAQNPQEIYNVSVELGFNATCTYDTSVPGSRAVVYIPASIGKFAWMEINQPGMGVYYLALYPLTPIKDYIITSNSGWPFGKIVGLVFANDTKSARGELLVVYGTSLSQVMQNIEEALIVMSLSSTQTTSTTSTSTQTTTTSTSSLSTQTITTTTTSTTIMISTTTSAGANHSTVVPVATKTVTVTAQSPTSNIRSLLSLLTNNQMFKYLIIGAIIAVIVVVALILTRRK